MGEPSHQRAALASSNAPKGNLSDDDRTSLLQSLRDWVKRLGGRPEGSIKDAIEDAIEEVLEEHENEATQLPAEEKAMLRNVLSFGEMSVQDIMIPRADILGVACDVTLDALKKHILEQRHTRIPVYRETLDRVEGFVHVKDIFMIIADGQAFDMKKLVRPLLFVPRSMRIIDLLVRMRRQRCHMAIVVDEYGGTDGLVTLEDLFEEIVGDIQDEHDEEENQQLVKISDTVYDADARVRIESLEQALGLNLLAEHEEEEFDTLGGLIFFELGRVPAKGEVVHHGSGVRFEILDADPRRVKRVRILQQEPVAAE
jgi:CBS domain containing-hemolysin-like protein